MGMTPVDIREADWDAYAVMGFEDLDLRSSNEKETVDERLVGSMASCRTGLGRR